MSKDYKNPPLTEAVFEVKYGKSVNFSTETIAAFSESIHPLFPIKKKAVRIETSINVGLEKKENDIVNKTIKFDTFYSPDEKYLVHLEENRISIHRLKPYISWVDFASKINAVLSAHIQHINFEKLIRIGVRYINEIVFPKDSQMKDAFGVFLTIPPQIEGEIKSLFCNLVLRVGENNDQLKVRIGDKKSTDKQNAGLAIMDLDYSNEKISFENQKDIMSWLDNAHASIEKSFESLLAEKLKSTFDI